MSTGPAARGRVYYCDLGYGNKPFVVISNNARNRSLDSCLAVRVTTSTKPSLPTVVSLAGDDPLVGRVLCDDIVTLFAEDLGTDGGALSPRTMAAVSEGLRHALSI